MTDEQGKLAIEIDGAIGVLMDLLDAYRKSSQAPLARKRRKKVTGADVLGYLHKVGGTAKVADIKAALGITYTGMPKTMAGLVKSGFIVHFGKGSGIYRLA